MADPPTTKFALIRKFFFYTISIKTRYFINTVTSSPSKASPSKSSKNNYHVLPLIVDDSSLLPQSRPFSLQDRSQFNSFRYEPDRSNPLPPNQNLSGFATKTEYFGSVRQQIVKPVLTEAEPTRTVLNFGLIRIKFLNPNNSVKVPPNNIMMLKFH